MQSIDTYNLILNINSTRNALTQELTKNKHQILTKNKHITDLTTSNRSMFIHKICPEIRQPLEKSIDRKIFKNRMNVETKINVNELLSVKRGEKEKQTQETKELSRVEISKDGSNIPKTHSFKINYL